MTRTLREHLAELAPPPLADALSAGDGFEVICGGAAATWQSSGGPGREGDALVWRFQQVAGPLLARLSLELDPCYRAARWQVELSNPGQEPVVIDAVYALVLRFNRLNGPWRTLTAGGGTTENFYPPRAYSPRERLVFGGEVRITSPEGGRSSDRHLPLMLACTSAEGATAGFFCGLEYSGQWFIALRHVGDSPFVRGGPRMENFTLAPGESIRLPPAHAGFFAGDLAAGTNALRRYVRDRVCPPVTVPPVSYDHWFGLTNDFDEPLLRRQLVRAARIGCEYWVHDAAWFAGGFPGGVGNWDRADPARYPLGLEPLAEAVRAAGMKFGLWFEIERAEEGTWAAREFPHLFFPPLPTWAGRSYHLNLALPEACDWAIETVGGWVRRLGLQWVRLDYNIDPGPYWRSADPTGKIEPAYCDGLYRLLDALRREHPELLIEACASGGRRLDLGTLRRAHTAWFSDETFNPDICRYMQCRFARFLPGGLANSAVPVNRGQGPRGLGEVELLSRFCGALSFDGDIASWPARQAERAKTWVERYKSIRHLLGQDFFQLLPTPTTDADWDAVQFSDGTVGRAGMPANPGGSPTNAGGPARPDPTGIYWGESVVFAFRMAGTEDRQALRLTGIDPSAGYAVKNLARPGRERIVPGAELLKRGLPLRLAPHTAVCIHLVRR